MTAHATRRLLDSHKPGVEPLRVLAASGQLGYGIPEEAFRRGMARAPHLIGVALIVEDEKMHQLSEKQILTMAADIHQEDLFGGSE